MLLKRLVLLALVSAVLAKDMSCLLKPSPDHPFPPPSIVSVTSAASLTDPALKSDISIVEGITVSSPEFAPVETTIESYVKSHYSTVTQLEDDDEHPSLITSPSAFELLQTDFPTLARAVTKLVSEEATHPSLADVQSSLQRVMVAYSTILTAGAVSFEFSHSTIVSAESGISEVAITEPRIVTDVEVLTTVVSISPSLSVDLLELTSEAEYYPSVLHRLTEATGWSKTRYWSVEPTLKTIASCYSTLYHAVAAFDTFLVSHSSVDSAFTDVVSALTTVPSIVTDVTNFVNAVSTTFTHALVSLAPALQIDSHLTTEVTYLDVLEASHPSLSCAEDTLEREITSHPSTVVSIEKALASPSTVTNPSYISSLEHRYASIVSAYDIVHSVQLSHPSLVYVQDKLDAEEQVVTSLLSAAEQVISETSPSLRGDASDMARIEYISPTITTVLRSLSSITKRSPSISCAESIIAHYASEDPSVLLSVSRAIESPSTIAKSSVASVAHLTAAYRSLASALREISSAEYKFPQLNTIESKLTYALVDEPSLVQVYKQLTEYDSIVSQEVCSFAPSTHK